jgi:SpoVK/Ycf46/Vps4 family AAA+-type ATPase
METFGQTDAPIISKEQESLGVLPYAEALSDFICQCEPPMTISIQGDWGTGKTSMMNLVQTILKAKLDNGQPTTETFWFNTWQFSQFKMQEDIAMSLLSSFLDDLEDCAKDAKKLVAKLGWLAVRTAASAVGVPNSVSEDVASALSKELDPAQQVKKLKTSISDAVIKRIEKTRTSRLVVFIDDLDRLMPERAVEVLEVIKIFLDIPHCVFVLAVDYPIVARGLEKKFGIGIGDVKSRSFFDKIIQLPFDLPVAQYNITGYMENLMKGRQLTKEDLQLLVQLAEHSVGANPRTLKRLMNTFQLLHSVAIRKNILNDNNVATEAERLRLLFATLCLQLAYQKIYRLLLTQDNSNLFNYLESLKQYSLLQKNNELLGELKRGGIENEEKLIRLTLFMGAVWKTIQLQSDGDDNNISETELRVFKAFLSLSSITDAIGKEQQAQIQGQIQQSAQEQMQQPAQEQQLPRLFPYKEELTQIFKEINLKFEQRLVQMGVKLVIEFDDNVARGKIGFYMRITPYPLDFFVYLDYRNKQLTVSLWGGSNREGLNKADVQKWIQSRLRESFKDQCKTDNQMGSEHYFLDRQPIKGEDATAWLNNYKELLENSLEKYLPAVEELYKRTNSLLPHLQIYADDLLAAIKQQFPSDAGFEASFVGKPVERYARIDMFHPDWNKKFTLTMQAQGFWLSNISVGITNVISKQGYSGYDTQVFELCKKKFTGNTGSNGRWVFFQDVNSPTLTLVNANFNFTLDTPEKRQEMIGTVVERLTRFKELLPELKELAARAE